MHAAPRKRQLQDREHGAVVRAWLGVELRAPTISRAYTGWLVFAAVCDNLFDVTPELKKRIGVVRGCRTAQKSDLIHNDYLPTIEVDPQNYQVRADGQLLWCEPAEVLPMAQRYFLF